MNYKILKLTLAAIGLLLVTNSKVMGNLASEFEAPKQDTVLSYERLDLGSPNVTLIQRADLEIAGNNDPADDGYYELDFNFDFDFAGVTTNKLWICVNGFITFVEPLNQPQDRPEGLFTDGNTPGTYQQYVIAPFWGDHYYRNVNDQGLGYIPSQILVESTDDHVTVEWRDLNINDESIPSSIGNFQVTIYSSTTTNTDQGDFEFSYGQINGGAGAVVITDGAAIGAKAVGSDYINGLCWDPDDTACDPFASRRLSNVWQPSGGSNFRIRTEVKPIVRVFESWGDGDTDLSQGRGQRHEGALQNRFVTFNDVRMILRSVVENVDLDSAIGREAFHADVDHDGRYYRVDTTVWARNDQGEFVDGDGDVLIYVLDADNDGIVDYDINGDGQIEDVDVDETDGPGPPTWIFYGTVTDRLDDNNRRAPLDLVSLQDSILREPIPIRSRRYQDDLPSKVSRINSELYFYADEDDAKWITTYLRASIPSLPWIYDTLSNGKVNLVERVADNIRFGEAENIDGQYRVPVFTNGVSINGLSNYFELDVNINKVELVTEDPFAIAETKDNKFVFAGSENYSSDKPFAYIYFETPNSSVNVNNVRFNDENASNTKINLNEDIVEVNYLSSFPTVFDPNSAKSQITVNVPIEGNYNLSVFDMNGNLVKTIYEGNMNTGETNFEFDGRDQMNKTLSNGVYIYRLNGNGINSSIKTIVE